jgi:hypothetical protein
LAWGNIEGQLLADTRIGGYLQVVNDPGNPTNGGRGDWNDITVSPANKAFAENITATLGRLVSGDKHSLDYSDGAPLRACKGFVPNVTVAPVTIQLDGVSNFDTLSALSLHVNSRMVNAGSFTQTIDLFDWSTNAYSLVDVLSTPITLTYQTQDVNATGVVSRYLGAGHELRGRLRVKQTGFAATPVWCTEFDEANFTITP